jgi:hypothetical protein
MVLKKPLIMYLQAALLSYETRYSGVYDASAFETQTLPFYGTGVAFYYV